MRTKTYIVRIGALFVSGKTIPNGLTAIRHEAHQFDQYLHALTYAERFAGTIEIAQDAHTDPALNATGQRAPQINRNEDNAVQAR